MKLYIDTANLEEIEWGLKSGIANHNSALFSFSSLLCFLRAFSTAIL